MCDEYRVRNPSPSSNFARGSKVMHVLWGNPTQMGSETYLNMNGQPPMPTPVGSIMTCDHVSFEHAHLGQAATWFLRMRILTWVFSWIGRQRTCWSRRRSWSGAAAVEVCWSGTAAVGEVGAVQQQMESRSGAAAVVERSVSWNNSERIVYILY